jgi:hypothetical protein
VNSPNFVHEKKIDKDPQLMHNNVVTANQQHNELSSNLYDLQFKSRELLSDRCLQQIYTKMNGWMQLNKVQGFLHQSEISKDIEHCRRHPTLADRLTSFPLPVSV